MTKNKQTNFCCPLCDSQLVLIYGDQIHPGNKEFGLSLYCENTKCPAQEVSGHTLRGKEKDAYQVILDKLKCSEEK